MNQQHPLIPSIANSMQLFPKGETKLVEELSHWSIEYIVSWKRRLIKVVIKSKKPDLPAHFPSCKLTSFHLFTLLSYMALFRSESYSFYGKKSIYSDVIMKSHATLALMEAKNATIVLDGKYLIFSGSVRKKDLESLSNVFKLKEILREELDLVIR